MLTWLILSFTRGLVGDRFRNLLCLFPVSGCFFMFPTLGVNIYHVYARVELLAICFNMHHRIGLYNFTAITNPLHKMRVSFKKILILPCSHTQIPNSQKILEFYAIKRHTVTHHSQSLSFKSSFLYLFWDWIRLYIRDGSISSLDFVYWLGSSQGAVLFLCIHPLGILFFCIHHVYFFNTISIYLSKKIFVTNF